MLLLATGLIAILAAVPILGGVAGAGERGVLGAPRTAWQTGERPGGPRSAGTVFLEDAQLRLAVGETKTREGERPASGHTVSRGRGWIRGPAGTSSLARDL